MNDRAINNVTPDVIWNKQIGTIKKESRTDLANTPQLPHSGTTSLTRNMAGISVSQNTFAMRAREQVKKIFRYGSQEIIPDWRNDLPDQERQLAESINRVVQEQSPEIADTAPPSRAGAGVAALQLLTMANLVEPHVNGAMQAFPAPGLSPKNKNSGANRLCMANRANAHWHAPALTRPVDQPMKTLARNPRAASAAAIEDEDIPNRILKLVLSEHNPVQSAEIDSIFRLAQTSPEVKNASPVEQSNTRLLLKCIELTAASMNTATDKQDLGETYRFFHFMLREFWDIANRLASPQSQDAIDSYKNNLLQKKWMGRKNKSLEFPLERNKKIITDYIKLEYPEWGHLGINGEEKIIIFTPDEAKFFSITEILDKAHVAFIHDKSISCQFQYDTTGLPDSELTEFVLVAETEKFAEFKEACLVFQTKRDSQASAMRLLQKRLEQLPQTPLYFQSHQMLQDIINDELEALASMPVTDRVQKRLIASLIDLAIDPPVYSAMEQAVLTYAHSVLLRGAPEHFSMFDIQRIFDADYVYRYQDQHGRYEFATTTLPAFLCLDTKFPNIAISQRKKISMLWPSEFSHDHIVFLEKNMITAVNIFSKNLRLAQQLSQLKQDLAIAMPPVSARLKTILQELGKKIPSTTAHCRIRSRSPTPQNRSIWKYKQGCNSASRLSTSSLPPPIFCLADRGTGNQETTTTM